MPVSWRIFKTRYSSDLFDGEGARLYGGRWTSPGNPAVYTADSVSLATLEILVHLGSASTLSHYSLASAAFPASAVQVLSVKYLPADWRVYPAPPALQRMGDKWIADAAFPVLQVPGAVVEQQSTFLLNPRHPQFSTFSFGTATAYNFDSRLFRP